MLTYAGIVFNRYIKMFEMVDEDDEGRPSPMTCVAIRCSLYLLYSCSVYLLYSYTDEGRPSRMTCVGISPSVRRVATGMSGGLLKVC
jgi:hypothetical protein